MPYKMQVPDDVAVRVKPETMQQVVEGIFRSLGAPEDDARRSAEALMYADVRGIDSHGVNNMMQFYVKWIREGLINPAPELKVLRETDAAATIDSDRGLGLTIAPQAMAMAIDKARRCGVGAVAVTNGRHFGAAAYHAALALEHDMIGIAMTCGGVFMAPTFAAEAMLGVNPLGVAVPAGSEAPFIFDASMSSVAVNKIYNAKRLGKMIPPGWIADEHGTPIMHETPAPDEFIVLPTGGSRAVGSHKGYGLAVMIDMLSGLLSGNPAGYQRPYGDVSHHLLAYRVDAFTELAMFKDHVDGYLKGLREAKPAPGEDRVLYAGLEEHETEIERRRRGIPYHPEVIAWHREICTELGVTHDLPN